MKGWKLTVVLLLGTSFVCAAESPAGFRCRRRPAAPCVVSPVPVMPRAEETVDLRWKFQTNKPFYVQIKTTTDQTMKVQAMDVVQKQEQTYYLRVTPEKRDKKGNWFLRLEFVGIRMSIDIGGNKIQYDSTKRQPKNPLSDFFKELLRLKLKAFLATDMSISRTEGQTEFIREFGSTNPQMEPLLKSILSEDALKKSFEYVLPPIPHQFVKEGESWNRKSNWDLGAIGAYEFGNRYVYAGKEDSLARINVEVRGSYRPPNSGNGLPFKILPGALATPKPMSGVIFVDLNHGRVVRASIPFKLEGALAIDVGGMITTVKLSQFQTTTIAVTDTNPIPAKRD